MIIQKQPKKVAINKSEHFALADGITATEYEAFSQALAKQSEAQLMSSEKLAIAWLETRSEMDMQVYPNLIALGRSGNEVLKLSRQQAIKEGIKPSIYTHLIGYHGHAVGTTLGI